MERLHYRPKPRIEPMYDVKGDAEGFKVYGAHAEMENIIRSQVQFAQANPQSQRRIEVMPESFGVSHIYSNERINRTEYTTDEGRQKLIAELLQLVSPSSTVIFNNQTVRRDNSTALCWKHPSIIQLRASLAGDSNLQMTAEDRDTFDRLFSNVYLNPDRWAEE